MGEKNTPEDILSGMFSQFTGPGRDQNLGKMMSTLIRNSKINILKQLRHELDINIRNLIQTGDSEMVDDENLDPYKVLGVDQRATREDIDKAFRAKSRVLHPDRPGGDETEMKRVSMAYHAIKQFRGWR